MREASPARVAPKRVCVSVDTVVVLFFWQLCCCFCNDSLHLVWMSERGGTGGFGFGVTQYILRRNPYVRRPGINYIPFIPYCRVPLVFLQPFLSLEAKTEGIYGIPEEFLRNVQPSP